MTASQACPRISAIKPSWNQRWFIKIKYLNNRAHPSFSTFLELLQNSPLDSKERPITRQHSFPPGLEHQTLDHQSRKPRTQTCHVDVFKAAGLTGNFFFKKTNSLENNNNKKYPCEHGGSNKKVEPCILRMLKKSRNEGNKRPIRGMCVCVQGG